MAKKDFLEQKYCEINKLKNLLQTYPKEYAETIIKVMQNVFDEISEYLDEEALHHHQLPSSWRYLMPEQCICQDPLLQGWRFHPTW